MIDSKFLMRFSIIQIFFHLHDKFHPLGERISLHLLRYRPFTVAHYSFMVCALQLKQTPLMKNAV